MKKLLLFVLVFTILTGCSGVEKDPSGSNVLSEGNALENINVPVTNINGNGLSLSIAASNIFSDNFGISNQDAIKEWQDYINKTYNLNITLINIGTGSSSEMVNKVTTGEYNGMTCFDSEDILPLIKQDVIEPLDDYLEANKVWNSLPEGFRKRFEYNGHIWAIPRMEGSNLQISSIRTDWLTKAGLEIPSTLKELTKAAETLSKQDPNDDNDTTNDYLFGGYYSDCNDIWNALGLYLNNGSTIAYDPTLGCIVDSMFKPEAYDALKYFRDLYQKGLLPQNFFSPYDTSSQIDCITIQADITQAKYTTGLDWAFQNDPEIMNASLSTFSDYQYKKATEIYEALAPLSKKNPVAYSYDPSGYVLSSSTANPQSVVNTFVDLMFSKQGYLDCTLGIPNHYTHTSDNIFILKYADEALETTYLRPNLVDTPVMILGSGYAIVSNSADITIATRICKESAAYEKGYISTYTASGQLARTSVFTKGIQSATYEIYGRKLNNLLIGVLSAITEEDVPISNIVNAYRKQAKEQMIETILQEANENAGLKF